MLVYFDHAGRITHTGPMPDSRTPIADGPGFDHRLSEALAGREDPLGLMNDAAPRQGQDPAVNWEGTYQTEMVGETKRAPMAMFANGDELVLSTISRNGISKSPVYSHGPETGLVQRSTLPDEVESGNYGFTAEDGVHIVAESWQGMVEYVAPSPDGPWTKHDLTALNPNEYKNLKWGFGYRAPQTGNQYLGFGNDRHPGVVLSRENDDWQVLATAPDMLFPTSMGEITSGKNGGSRLIVSSTYGETRVHVVDREGHTRKVAEFDGWSYGTVDPRAEVAYVASESGQVYWSAFDDLENWQPVQVVDRNNTPLTDMGRAGEINIHPGSGQVILPVADDGWIGNNEPTPSMGTTLYAAFIEDGIPVFRPVQRIEGAGLWELRTAAVGDDLYLGTGLAGPEKQDGSPGGVFRITATAAGSGEARSSAMTGLTKPPPLNWVQT